MEEYKKCIIMLIAAFSGLFLGGCESPQSRSADGENKIDAPVQLDTTVGKVAEFSSMAIIPVKGIGIVVGLPGTGSSECPPDVRSYLNHYILSRLGKRAISSPDMMIDSKDTAVVLVEGFIHPGSVKQDLFDVKVRALVNTQTSSLNGGRLYTTELKLITQIDESIEASKTLALAAGPVYLDLVSDVSIDPRQGYVVGGGKSMQDYQVNLALFKPDFRQAAAVRNRINERFGKGTASAVSDNLIYISVPPRYYNDREYFFRLVSSLYLAQSEESKSAQIELLVEKLKFSPDKSEYEISLEAIGNSAIRRLRPLLSDTDEFVRFSAARCLLRIGDGSGFDVLRAIAQDRGSSLRLDAIEVVGKWGSKSDAVSLMRRLVRGEDFAIRYAGYKYLRKYKDSSIVRTVVAKDFYIDSVVQIGEKGVYASRSGELGIVLFGAPIYCEPDIYVESADGSVIINSLPGEKSISVMRKHPYTKSLMGPLKCGFSVSDLIRTLGEPPAREEDGQRKRIGLGLSYSDILCLLEDMSDKGAIKADFIVGPGPDGR